MRRLLAAALIVAASVTAAPPPAEAHIPTCHFGTVYPWMYTHRSVLVVGNPYIWYFNWYSNVSTGAEHGHRCKVFVA